MNFFKKAFAKKYESVKPYEQFWNWFQNKEQDFYKVVKEKRDLEEDFFDKLSHKLDVLKKGIWYVAGMYTDNVAELILTADGDMKNIAFVEELVSNAPTINGWRFTALKPALDIEDVNIEMDGYSFNGENLFFYANSIPECPDEIDITVEHPDFNDENKDIVISGVHIFLDNFLGELNFATVIDSVSVTGRAESKRELIPIAKLKDFLTWRQKEFVEKYEGVKYDAENEKYSLLEAELESGNTLVAVINRELLEWDSKASHPWILNIEVKYDGSNNNGLPDKEMYNLLDEIEEKIMKELPDNAGYLNIGRQTANNLREIYFACREYRKPSKVLYNIQLNYFSRVEISYDIYKDKYWRSFRRFEKTID